MNKLILILAVGNLLAACAAPNAVRYPPHRWLKEIDRTPIEKPRESRQYKYWDIADMQFFYRLEEAGNIPTKAERLVSFLGLGRKQEALNVNNFDEVADSTWFTNRIGRRPLPVNEAARGPDQGAGPDPHGPWTILSAKTEGLSPGLLIEDGHGDRYLIKFDPPGYAELASGAEAISTRLLHAFGYNVPENYVVTFDRKILKVSSNATTKDRYGRKIPFTENDVEDLFGRCECNVRGLYRALASKLLEGEPLGPFSFTGRRGRDRNDRIPHQHRRELRGYQVISAWLNHGDSRAANTLDTFLRTDGDLGFVRHTLIDFGGTLGSAGVRPKGKEHLYDYRLNYARTLAALGMVGLYRPYWENAEAPENSAVGFFESKLFEPQKWKPTYLNPAFRYMTPRDGFWAAKIVMKISDTAIAAIVKEARYSDPRSAEYVTKTLIERRDKIGRYWFRRLNPLDDFTLTPHGEGAVILFEDLAIESGLAESSATQYRYRWLGPHGNHDLTPWNDSISENGIEVPPELVARLKQGKIYLLHIQTKRGKKEEPWSPPLDLLIKKDGDLQIVGLKRHY